MIRLFYWAYYLVCKSKVIDLYKQVNKNKNKNKKKQLDVKNSCPYFKKYDLIIYNSYLNKDDFKQAFENNFGKDSIKKIETEYVYKKVILKQNVTKEYFNYFIKNNNRERRLYVEFINENLNDFKLDHNYLFYKYKNKSCIDRCLLIK